MEKVNGMRVWLARHGETDWNAERRVQGQTDTQLNANGIAQARRLSGQLAQQPDIVKVYCSRLERARVTAQIVADRIGVPCEVRDNLEELAFGDWEGCTHQEMEERWPELYARWRNTDNIDLRPPNGETFRELRQRFGQAVADIIREGAEGNIVIVAHGGCIRSLLKGIGDARGQEGIANATGYEIDPKIILNLWP